MAMTDKPRVVLIDLSSLFWTAWMINTENGSKEARSITLANVKRCIAEPTDLVAICCDSGKSFRKELSAEYKANREKQPEAAYGELQKTKDRLRADGYLLWEAPNFEADDVIATACQYAYLAGHNVRVCSADKDMFQLIGPTVDCLRTSTWEVWDERKFTEKFGVKVDQFTDWLALKGDASDNVPGCPKIGDKTATALLVKHGSIAGIYAALGAGTSAVENSLRDNRAQVELSRKLVELRYDAPITFGDIYEERKVTPLNENSEMPPVDDEPESAKVAMDPADVAQSSKSTTQEDGSSPTGAPVSTALVQVEYTKQLEPRSMSGAVWLGRYLYDSRMYTRFPNAEAITAVILRGRELGIGAATALDVFHFIEGRPAPHAYFMIARAKADPDCEYFYCESETSTAEQATWVTKNRRNPKEQRLTYTLEMAKASGLYVPGGERTDRNGNKYRAKDNQWVVRPSEMVRKTAGVQLARMEYPAATLGLYAWEELSGDE